MIVVLFVKRLIIKLSVFIRTLGQKRFLYYYLIYTLCFTFIATVIYSILALNDKSFIQLGDGLMQHFNCLVYYGDYLRNIIQELVRHGKLIIPQWDFHIGYGMDVLTTMNYYTIGDPLNLLSVFVSPQKTEYLYDVLILLRMYLAGVSFSILCFYHKKSRFGTLIGALIYVFCGFALFAGVRHPFFLNPMIYFPFILLGIEKIFRKEKPYVFIFSIALSAMSNFYFFYMLTALSCLYAFFRQFDYIEKKQPGKLPILYLKFAGYYLTGISLGALLFLPTLFAFFNCGRFDSGYKFSPFLYDIDYYKTLFVNFLSTGTSGYWTIHGFGSIALVAIVVMFCRRKRHRVLKLAFLFTLLLHCIPLAGYALNGFGYVANRWVFGFSLLVASIVVTVIPVLNRINKKELCLILCSAIVYGLFIIVYPENQNDSSFYAFGILVFTVIVLFVFYSFDQRGRKIHNTAITKTLLFVTIVGICTSGFLRFSPDFGNYVSTFCNSGQVLKELTSTQNRITKKISDNSFHRIDYNSGSYSHVFNNDALQLKYNSTSAYYSLMDSKIVNFFFDMNIPLQSRQRIPNLDSRAQLEAVSGVKYFTTDSERPEFVPYGFYKIDEQTIGNKKYELYQNKNFLPLGFTYSSFIKADEYESLPTEKKQQAMLQGVVLNDSIGGYETTSLSFDDITANCSMEYNHDEIVMENNRIFVKKPKAKITVVFEPNRDNECYLKFTNLSFIRPIQSAEFKQYKDMNAIPVKRINKLSLSEINVSSLNMDRTFELRTTESTYYTNQHNFMVNMGYNAEGINKLVVSFGKTGEYSCDKIDVIFQPMGNFNRQVGELKADVMENEKVGVNSVSGTVSLEEDKILCLSIPYSKGWSAKVNGIDTDILTANVQYMALPLKAGENAVELKYETPFLKAGACISAATLIIVLVFMSGLPVCIIGKHKKKQ